MYECLTRTGPAVRGQGRGTRAAAQPRQELGMVRGRPHADHAPRRGRQVVRRRSLRHRRRDVLLGRQRPRSQRHAARAGAIAGILRRGDDARGARTPTPSMWTFKEAFPKQYLYTMAYGTSARRPAHILKPHASEVQRGHDRTKSTRTASPPEYMNFPVMGAWVPVEYRPDDIIVHAPQPLLLEGRRGGQPAALSQRAALSLSHLGRPRRAGRGRHGRSSPTSSSPKTTSRP